jgi:hypothetical protein
VGIRDRTAFHDVPHALRIARVDPVEEGDRDPAEAAYPAMARIRVTAARLRGSGRTLRRVERVEVRALQRSAFIALLWPAADVADNANARATVAKSCRRTGPSFPKASRSVKAVGGARSSAGHRHWPLDSQGAASWMLARLTLTAGPSVMDLTVLALRR